MANIKITDLTAYGNPTSTDVLPIVDVGADVTKKVSIADLLENAGSGTEALPGIAFDGDPDTGIYRPGEDQLAISTNGTGRLFVDASGDVGVATASPQFPLDVAGNTRLRNNLTVGNLGALAATESIFVTGADRALYLSGATSSPVYLRAGNPALSGYLRDLDLQGNDVRVSTGASTGTSVSERLRITSAGLVGIGTSSPSYKLDVAGAGRYFSSTTDAASLYLSKTNSGTADQGGNKIYFSNDGPTATARASGTLIGALQFQASQPTSGSLQNCGAIEITADGTQAGVYTPTKIQLSTSSSTYSSGTNIVAMTIDSSQRVGIGDTGPDSTLTIKAATSVTPLRVSGPSSEFARIDSSGRLLVGTSSDSGGALLQVNGDRIKVATAKTPASASDTGTTGEICWDASYIYVCTATNTWKRAALSTW